MAATCKSQISAMPPLPNFNKHIIPGYVTNFHTIFLILFNTWQICTQLGSFPACYVPDGKMHERESGVEGRGSVEQGHFASTQLSGRIASAGQERLHGCVVSLHHSQTRGQPRPVHCPAAVPPRVVRRRQTHVVLTALHARSDTTEDLVWFKFLGYLPRCPLKHLYQILGFYTDSQCLVSAFVGWKRTILGIRKLLKENVKISGEKQGF